MRYRLSYIRIEPVKRLELALSVWKTDVQTSYTAPA